MMKSTLEPVLIELVNIKERMYHFSLPASLKPLILSIEQTGLIHPVVLTRDTGKYSVVCGYKRVLACIKLGRREVEALILPPGKTPLELFYMNITDTLSQRELHFIEAGTVLGKLKERFSCPRDELVKTHMKLLGLAPSGFILDRLLSLSALEAPVKRFIVHGKIPLHVSEHFLRFTSAERVALVRILCRLKFGTNKVKEFLVHLKEISIRESASPLEIIDRLKIDAVSGDRELSTSEAGASVRSLLNKNRFPVTETLEKEFQRLLLSFALPQGVSLSHSKNFEDSSLKMVLSVKNPRQLAALSRSLLELSGHEQFSKLFDIA